MYTFEQCKKLELEIGTPAYLVNEDLFLNNLRDIRAAFKSLYQNIVVGYSFKTNYLPYLCKLALEQGCYAEVVSFLEYQIALKVGFTGNQIIFNGPIKRESEFVTALLNGSVINIDSDYEIDYLERLKEIYPENQFEIGLRVNVSIKDENGCSAIYGEEESGRFGFIEDEIDKAIERLTKINCKIISLHGHTSSKNRAINNYVQIIDKLFEIQHHYKLDIKYINIGGGFFGPVPPGMFGYATPSYKDYAEVIIAKLHTNRWFCENRPCLVIEPGMSVAASSMAYITKVFDVKKRSNRWIAQVDGNMFHIRPSMHTMKIPFQIISGRVIDNVETKRIDFAGSTCMESDVLVRTETCRQVHQGDFLEIDNVGGYTFVMGANFIQFLPHIAILKNNEFISLREGSNFDNFIEIFNW